MGDLIPITQHEKFILTKARAEWFYGIDCNLDENARSLYHFLIGVSNFNYGLTYLKWPTMEDAITNLQHSEWGRNHSTATIKNAFSQLRKNRYLRFTYNRELEARVMELIEFVGENARS